MWQDDTEEEPLTSNLPDFYKLVDKNKSSLIDDLKEAVAIPSVSHEHEHFPDIIKMLKFCGKKLEELGGIVEIVENKTTGIDGAPLPPVLLGNLFVDKKLKKICVYGHVDTLPPNKANGWESDPFTLTENNGRLYGCGVAENKAPLMCWFNALRLYKATGNELPVNVKFVIEGTAELRSCGLEETIRNKQEFFDDVEYICLTIDKMLDGVPCLKYGFRGVCHFALDVDCGEKNVHSGTFGGAFNQPLVDAVNVIGALTDKRDKISVEDVLKDVLPISSKEEEFCKQVPFNIGKVKERISAACLKHKEIGTRLTMHATRLPSISIHSFDIESDHVDKRNLASVPNRVVAKFSVRLVPNQSATKTYHDFKSYISKIWLQSKSVNRYTFTMNLGLDPWREDPDCPHYKAAASAIESVYSVKPKYVCEGSTLPAISILKAASVGSSLLVLPISDSEEQLHTSVESISTTNFINGAKLALAYMCHVREIQ